MIRTLYCSVVLSIALAWVALPQDHTMAEVSPELPEASAARHARVAERRARTHLICHRGALEFAHENTLEAYRAALELGADGNEIDIRCTKDGVLVCFHDDMLDRILEGYGSVRETDWAELRRLRFRDPGVLGPHCRIPTLLEVFELHRRHAGLIHLDIKEHGLDDRIAELLTRMDIWDHVAYCGNHADAIRKDPRLQLEQYKAGLYEQHEEVFPEAIAEALQKPGRGLILEDPRGALLSLGRSIGRISRQPIARLLDVSPRNPPDELAVLLTRLGDAADWNRVAETDEEQLASGRRIRERAQAAEDLLALGVRTDSVFAALEARVRHRSLHQQWIFHGHDGEMALRTLIRMRAPQAVTVAREVLWRDDSELSRVQNPEFKVPRSWTDFRIKTQVFRSLPEIPGGHSEKLCRDYLALSEETARQIGPPQFEEAARALLRLSPTTGTAVELMSHRLRAVRGRTILTCLQVDQPWTNEALAQSAPHALAYRLLPKP